MKRREQWKVITLTADTASNTSYAFKAGNFPPWFDKISTCYEHYQVRDLKLILSSQFGKMTSGGAVLSYNTVFGDTISQDRAKLLGQMNARAFKVADDKVEVIIPKEALIATPSKKTCRFTGVGLDTSYLLDVICQVTSSAAGPMYLEVEYVVDFYTPQLNWLDSDDVQQASVSLSGTAESLTATITSAVRNGLPDIINLESVSLAGDQFIDRVAAKLQIPGSSTAQVLSAGNWVMSAIGSVGGLQTFGQIFQRPSVGLNVLRVSNDTFPSDMTTSDYNSYYALTGDDTLECKLMYLDANTPVSLDFTTQDHHYVDLMNSENIAPVVQFKNLSAVPKTIYLGKVKQVLIDRTTVVPDSTLLSVKVALNSFLNSW